MPGYGRFYTPPSLAAALVQRTIPAGARRVTVCDPACGDGALLAAVAARFPEAALIGFDIDPAAVASARERLPGATIVVAAALANPVPQSCDYVVANPPWVSFSGRHAQPLGPDRRAILERFETFARWPTLHGPFVELVLRLAQRRAGILLPAQVCELEGYGPLRRHVRQHAEIEHPILEFGENAFPCVTQPTCGLVLRCRAQPSATVDADPERSARRFGGRDELPDELTRRPRPPREMFLDIGIHSGNCAAKLFDRGGRPVREGRDIAPFVVHEPRRTFAAPLQLEPGEYFRTKDLAVYQAIPIVLRQTAARPIAALHRAPTYFRNSVLGCRPPSGVAPELVVAWLNSTAVAWYHKTRVAESNQRAFPQMKLKHLRDLPMPDWNDAPRELVHHARAVAHHPEHEPTVDRLVWQWMGLPESEWGPTRVSIGATPVLPHDTTGESLYDLLS